MNEEEASSPDAKSGASTYNRKDGTAPQPGSPVSGSPNLDPPTSQPSAAEAGSFASKPQPKFDNSKNPRHWGYTFHNYTEEDVTQIVGRLKADQEKEVSKRKVVTAAFGREVCPTTGRPHLQGYIHFKSQTRQVTLFNFLGYSGPQFHVYAHENRFGPPIKMFRYCLKEGPDKVFTIGKNPVEAMKKKAKLRKELGRCTEDVKDLQERIFSREFTTMKQVRKAFPELSLKYEEQLKSYIAMSIPLPTIPDHPLRPWQEKLSDKWATAPNGREVVLVVDKKGNAGKTWFGKHVKAKDPDKTIIVGADKRDGITFEVKNHIVEYGCPELLIMDAPRTRSQYISFAFLEEVKDQVCRSRKYKNDCISLVNEIHVAVMTNQFPEKTEQDDGLSDDRYVYLVINEDGQDGEWKYGYLDPKKTNCFATIQQTVQSTLPNSLQSAMNNAAKRAAESFNVYDWRNTPDRIRSRDSHDPESENLVMHLRGAMGEWLTKQEMKKKAEQESRKRVKQTKDKSQWKDPPRDD